MMRALVERHRGILPLTSLVYPDFKQQDYATRLATRKNYLAGGKQFQELQALNTVGGVSAHNEDLSAQYVGDIEVRFQ